MTTAISNPKTKYLLGAGLDVLHYESKEWLNTIAFWKDEVKFFDNLLKLKESSKMKYPDFEKMLKDLKKIHVDLFKDLEDTIKEHEQLLARILRAEKGLSDSNYREKHSQIKDRIKVFESDFRTFKKIVFDYVKKL